MKKESRPKFNTLTKKYNMDYKKILWISYSAISSYERCPHSYYLGYIYRNPSTQNRIQIVNPYFSLGSAVHDTIEGLLDIDPKKRQKVSLTKRFSDIFNNYRGHKGGFISKKKEEDFFNRGIEMVERVEKSKFLSKPSTKPISNFLSIDLIGQDVKLVGSIDWVELLPTGEAHIIDFKTGKTKENSDSLQLPIYTVLAKDNVKEKVKKVSYWYLESDDNPVEQEIKNVDDSLKLLRERATEIQEAIKNEDFPCNYNGKCFSCRDYEKVFSGDAELIETGNNRNKDTFCIFKEEDVMEKILDEDFLDEREKKIFELRMSSSLSEINQSLRLSEEKSEKLIYGIKEKLKKNLHKKELKVIVNLLKK